MKYYGYQTKKKNIMANSLICEPIHDVLYHQKTGQKYRFIGTKLEDYGGGNEVEVALYTEEMERTLE